MYVDGSTTVVGGLPWDGGNLSHTYSWGFVRNLESKLQQCNVERLGDGCCRKIQFQTEGINLDNLERWYYRG